MSKSPDLIAERAFFVNGNRNGGPAVVFRYSGGDCVGRLLRREGAVWVYPRLKTGRFGNNEQLCSRACRYP